ncbi:MAG: hypothetical protein ACR2PM_04515 [Hyphomicrobiales bacterium]
MFSSGAIHTAGLRRLKVDLSNRSDEVDLSPSKAVAILQLIFAAVWLSFCIPLTFAFGQAPIYVMAFVAMFPLLGIGMVVGALSMLLRSRVVSFKDDGVAVKERSWLTAQEWHAPYSEFEGVLWREYTRRSKNSTTTFQIIELKHSEPEKTLPLQVSTKKKLPRRDWDDYARRLKLPALRQSGDDVIERAVGDLDKSLKDLTEENKVNVAWDPNQPVPDGLATEPVTLPDGDGLRVTILAPLYPLTVQVMFYAVPSVFIGVGAIAPGAWPAALIGAAFMALAWFSLRHGNKASRYILLSRDTVTVHDGSRNKRKAERTIRLDDIAGITVQRARSGMGPELRIGSRQDETAIGQGLSRDALDWLRNYIIAAIATA